MSFSIVQTNYATSSDTVALSGVTAGNLIAVCAMWENNTVDNIAVSDGTTSFEIGTCARSASSDGVRSQWSYLLSANGGNKTYTCTFPSGGAVKRLFVFEISYTGGTLSFDTQQVGSGNSDAAQTANFNTANSDGLVMAGICPWSWRQEPASSYQIADAAADGDYTIVNEGLPDGYVFYKAFSAAQTNIHAQCALNSSDEWAIAAMAFKVAAAASSIVPLLLSQYRARRQ